MQDKNKSFINKLNQRKNKNIRSHFKMKEDIFKLWDNKTMTEEN